MAELECQKRKDCRDWYLLSQQVEGEGWLVEGVGGFKGIAELECQKRKASMFSDHDDVTSWGYRQ